MLSEAMTREMNNLTAVIDEAFDEDDKKSALSRIESTVRDLTESMVREAFKSVQKLLNPAEEDSLLSNLKGGIVNEINASMQQFSQTLGQVHHWLETQAAVAAEADKGTAKGRTFEDQVCSILTKCANATGD